MSGPLSRRALLVVTGLGLGLAVAGAGYLAWRLVDRTSAPSPADADRLQGVFISVDPARDTPEHLQQYVSYFDSSFLGLTGSEAEIAKVAKAYGAHYEKEAPAADGSYEMAHTAFGYLIGPGGKVVQLFQPGTSPEAMAQAVETLF
jgi:protein SCO1/2